MSLRVFASAAALGLFLTGCASFNLSSDQRHREAAAPAPIPTLPAQALTATVEGSGAIPAGSVLTLSLFDAANPVVTLYSQEFSSAPAAFPWSVQLDAPGQLLEGGRSLALGAVVKNAVGAMVYANDAPGSVSGGLARATVVSTGF